MKIKSFSSLSLVMTFVVSLVLPSLSFGGASGQAWEAFIMPVQPEAAEAIRSNDLLPENSVGENVKALRMYLRELDGQWYLLALLKGETEPASIQFNDGIGIRQDEMSWEPMEKVFYDPGAISMKPEGEIIRIGMVTGLKPDKEAHYRLLHDNPWPDVIKAIKKAKLRDFSIFLEELNGKLYLFGFLEYVGSDIAADSAENKKDPASIRWWRETDACQIPPSDAAAKGEMWAGLEELYRWPEAEKPKHKHEGKSE